MCKCGDELGNQYGDETLGDKVYLNVILRVRLWLGFALMYAVLPFYRLAMRLIHGYWFTNQELWVATSRIYLVREYGGQENVDMLLSFAETYVIPGN